MTDHYIVVDAEAGSHLYGTNIDGSDSDTMGLAIGTAPARLGTTVPEQWGKDDHVMYELSKYVRLVINGNPTVLQLLYTPQTKWLMWDAKWPQMQASLRSLCVSERCRSAFLGYLDGQRKKLINGRGQRRELIEKYGYDTKFAGHMVRLALQGVEMVAQGKMELPMHPLHAQLIVDIREGKFTQQQTLDMAEEMEHTLKTVPSVLPDKVDVNKINDWLASTYVEWWGYSKRGVK